MLRTLQGTKFESSETPTRTGTVKCQLKCLLPVKRWPNQKSLQILAKCHQWRCVSESDNCQQTVRCEFSVICSAVTQKPKVQDQHGALELQ